MYTGVLLHLGHGGLHAVDVNAGDFAELGAGIVKAFRLHELHDVPARRLLQARTITRFRTE